ncbi:hypothetical protein P3342_007348 [Pyrenophora teres f. teres]|nr:hypothetical protein P3342_007348 [Pyrenophora teres f. teres]
MKNLLRTIQGQLTPDAQTPGGTPSAGHQQAPTHNPPAADLDVRKFEKPRLPDVKVFDKDHTRTRRILRGPSSKTEGSSVSPYDEARKRRVSPTRHVRTFNLKFHEAGLGEKNDSLKIDYLQNSLNKKLLRYQAGYQPPLNETYDNFVQRMRVTWENLKAIDQLSSNAPIYSTKLFYQPYHQRRNGLVTNCRGNAISYERGCKATVPKRQRKPENTAKVLAANVEDESSDEGKKSPSPKAPTRAVQAGKAGYVIVNRTKNATAMIDHRYCTYALVCEDIVRELNLPRVPIPPRRINGVDNQKSTVQVITHFTIDAGGVRKEVAAYIILSTYEYDMILGKTWLE